MTILSYPWGVSIIKSKYIIWSKVSENIQYDIIKYCNLFIDIFILE